MKKSSLLIGSLLAVQLPAAHAVLIDSFFTGQVVKVDVPVGPVVFPLSNSGTALDSGDNTMVGGERDVKITVTDGTGGENAKVVADFGDSLLKASQDSSIQGSFHIAWDGIDGDAENFDPTGLGGIDLTEGGSKDGILMLLDHTDLAVSLTMNIYTDADNFSTFTTTFRQELNDTHFGFLFKNFEQGSGALGAADFSNVGAIELMLNGPQAFDVRVTFVESAKIPLSSSLWLMGLMLIPALRVKAR